MRACDRRVIVARRLFFGSFSGVLAMSRDDDGLRCWAVEYGPDNSVFFYSFALEDDRDLWCQSAPSFRDPIPRRVVSALFTGAKLECFFDKVSVALEGGRQFNAV